MSIHLAEENQLDEIFDLLCACKAALEVEHIYQWTDHYPTRQTIAQDIAQQQMFFLHEEGQTKGVVVLNEYQDPEYASVNWQVKEGRVLVVHRLAVHPHYQKQGIARQLMDFAEGYAAKHGYSAIRLDSYSSNKRSVRFYEQRGYTRCGIVHFPGRELEFYCCEKRVS